MPVSEHDLRELLRERSDVVPVSAGLAQRVQLGVRRRRRFEAGGVAAALVLVLVATGLVALPRRGSDAPVNPVPTVTHDVTINGLQARTTGPRDVTGTDPFDVSITVTNPGPAAWTGTVGIGVATTAPVPTWFDGGVFELVQPDFTATTNLGGTVTASNLQFQGFAPRPTIKVAPGETRTWTYRAQRDATYTVVAPVLGWVAYADPDGSDADATGDLGTYPALAVSPTASTLACGAVTVTSFRQGRRGSWEVSSAYHALVGADRTPTWTALRDVNGRSQDVVTSAGGDVRVTTVVAALQAQEAGTSVYPSDPALPSQLAPGEYIVFAGEQMVPVTFVGTCHPSGSTITGTWTSIGPTGEGILDCTVTPIAGSMAAAVKQYCRR